MVSELDLRSFIKGFLADIFTTVVGPGRYGDEGLNRSVFPLTPLEIESVMKVFLTGATGLLGNNVLRELIGRDVSVRCLTRTPLDRPPASLKEFGDSSGRQAEGKAEVELVQGQLTKCNDWRPLIEGCDAVIHSAGNVHLGWRRLEESRQINVVPTKGIAQACTDLKIRMIHISSVDTLPHSEKGQQADEQTRHPLNPPNNYVVSKTEAEEAVKECCQNGLDAVVIHPGFLLGPNDWKPSSGKMLISISKKEIPMAPIGGCSAVDVRNVASGICNAIKKAKAGENYILGGHNVHYKELFDRMADVIGVNPPKKELRPIFASIGKTVANFVNLFLKNEGDFNSAMIEMGQLNHFYSSQKAIDQLGYEITDLDVAIQDAWEFVRKVHLN